MPHHFFRPKIAVIGAGWAGLSAAVKLVARADVTLFEAGKQAGGRARTLGADHDGFSFLDNGQHILIGAYHGVAAMLRQIGVDESQAFVKLPLQWHIHQGLQFQTASLPAPWHIAFGLMRARNISLSDRFKLLRDMQALQTWHHKAAADTDIASWLRRRNTPRKLWGEFWQPLVWGALNTPPQHASLRTLCHVLSDGVWADKAGSDYWLPKQDLGALMAKPALDYLQRHGAAIRLETRVLPLENLPDGRIRVNGEAFDRVILAVAPYHAAALMPSETPDNIQTTYREMRYHAITTVYLRYRQPLRLPTPMTGLADGTAQWLIDRGALGLADNEIAAVISVSDTLGIHKSDDWAQKVHADVKRLCPYLAEPAAVRVITEKRATPAATVNQSLPDLAWLHHRGIYPAGDYLHPRYPATLEAAVQSGAAAADLCLADWKSTPSAALGS